MYSPSKHRAKLSPLALVLAGLLTSPVTGMQAMAQDGVLEEVIVTARKREESLQETPVAVSALSGLQLEEAGLNDLTDLDRIVPNLTANIGAGGGSTQLFIRGVGARNSGAQILAEVAQVAPTIWVTRRPPRFLPDDVDGRVLFDRATAAYRAQQAGPGAAAPVLAEEGLGQVVMVPPVRAARARGRS